MAIEGNTATFEQDTINRLREQARAEAAAAGHQKDKTGKKPKGELVTVATEEPIARAEEFVKYRLDEDPLLLKANYKGRKRTWNYNDGTQLIRNRFIEGAGAEEIKELREKLQREIQACPDSISIANLLKAIENQRSVNHGMHDKSAVEKLLLDYCQELNIYINQNRSETEEKKVKERLLRAIKEDIDTAVDRIDHYKKHGPNLGWETARASFELGYIARSWWRSDNRRIMGTVTRQLGEQMITDAQGAKVMRYFPTTKNWVTYTLKEAAVSLGNEARQALTQSRTTHVAVKEALTAAKIATNQALGSAGGILAKCKFGGLNGWLITAKTLGPLVGKAIPLLNIGLWLYDGYKAYDALVNGAEDNWISSTLKGIANLSVKGYDKASKMLAS